MARAIDVAQYMFQEDASFNNEEQYRRFAGYQDEFE